MKSWALVIYFFSESIFFSTLSLFSIVHTTDSSSYTYYNLVWSILIGSLCLFSFAKKSINSKLVNKSKLYIIALFLTLATNVIYSYFYFNQSPIILQTILYFFGLTFPSILLALSISDLDINQLFRRLKYINLYLSFCFALSFIMNAGGDGIFSRMAGASHLMIGYTMSALFPFNFIKMTQEKLIIKKFFYLCLSLSNVLIIALSGSRGALVSVIFTFLILMYLYGMRKRKTLKFLFLTSIIAILSFVVIDNNDKTSLVFQRLLLTFNSDVNTASAGRDEIYTQAFSRFQESPIFGNGIGSFGYSYGYYIYPHNIVLEILNDFGLFGLVVFLIILIKVVRKIFAVFKQEDVSRHIVAFFFISSFISLIFSGSYLVHSQFWISFVLLMTTRTTKNVHKSINKEANLHSVKLEESF